MMRNYWKLVTVLLVVPMIAVGCGSSETSDSSSGSADKENPSANVDDTAAASAAPFGQLPPLAPQDNSADPAPPAAPPNPETEPYPRVVINTSLGRVVVELDRQKADLTVRNFLDYVQSGHYDQTIFHQVLKDDIVLGGMFTADLAEKACTQPVRPLYNEAHNGLKNTQGTIAMVRRIDVIDSATYQFFFNLADNPRLDHQANPEPGTPSDPTKYGYCVFGRVVEGLDVLQKIGQMPVCDKPDFERTPVETVLIESAQRLL